MTDWAQWRSDPANPPYTLGVEEEVMLLDPEGWSLAQAIADVLRKLPPDLAARVSSETHSAAVELGTGVHPTVTSAIDELVALRSGLADVLGDLGLAAAVAGTHPFAVWQEMVVTDRARHQLVFGSMRELARREPTFALHVHVGIHDPDRAIRAFNNVRAHLPVLLALSANSPFWQGRDTGLASARTPLFQAFPRVGIPRPFHHYDEYVAAIDQLIRCEAFPDPTFLWWDIRMQPRIGTVEIRIMDAQSTVTATRALVAFVQSLVRLEAEEGWADQRLVHAPEALDENRFLAARDGTGVALLDLAVGGRVSLKERVETMLDACRPHAQDLGCEDDLDLVPILLSDASAPRQRRLAAEAGGLPGLVEKLSTDFTRVKSAEPA